MVVIALHAWGTMFPELRKFSFTLATNPVVNELNAIGWNHVAVFRPSHLGLAFLPNTTGLPVVLGKAVERLAFGGSLSDYFDGPSPRAAEVEQVFRRYYPTLKPLPVFGRLGGHPNIIFGIGFSGEVVVPTVIGSRIISALVRD